MMPVSGGPVLIRDGAEDDIPACLALDSRFETTAVLQVYLHGRESHGWELSLQRERLPRPVELNSTVQRAPLRAALDQGGCFLVAERTAETIVGCLVMSVDDTNSFALIRTLVVGADSRRRKIATRLIAAAGVWAREHHCNRLMAELQTKNAPAISFLESLGFQFCGFNDRYFSDENVALFFCLPLK
ncbi:MAG TPA: GNAT family N-acetyltransferase [Candidatus Limnocylindrales bacterium]|nr:GNAT family N-acetyltransferase [Candidatus Limnocylindrales bacterium]